jgi:histidinol-phosphate aminotransferase
MRQAIRPDTRLIWIANPNNPTGTFLPYAQLRRFLQSVPAEVVVVLDEAYNEYLPPAERVETTAWLAEHAEPGDHPHLLEDLRLAGLRIGYALTSAEIADLMNRVRQPFNCNNLALAGRWRRSTTTNSSPASYA